MSDFREAHEAQELHGIYRDLEFVKEAIEILDESKALLADSEEQEDAYARVVNRSLYTAALIACARCFGKVKKKPSGKRILLDPEQVFSGRHKEWKGHHRHFINVRDKHLAHSVNPFEINRAAMFVKDWNEDPTNLEVGVLHVNRESEAGDNVLALAKLAEIAMEHTYNRSDALLNKLYKKVTSMTPEALQGLPPFILEFRQGPEDVAGPRE